ncbi:MAG: cysteine--tRNA ligase [Clostridia bacterium]|nr:cysteine--tRNA ligase [Clostridia bacterium]
MKVYNTMSGSKEELIPLEEKKIKMYACGVTVYDQCHIGHARQAIVYDVINQYLRYRGYEVTYVRNYTDVDDKIIARANELNMNALDYSKQKIVEAEEDLSRLKVRNADITPKASENIDNIVDFCQKLIEKGHAYLTEKGDVYFSVNTFPQYGKLSKRKTEELIDGVRKDVEEGKKDPKDFALWKSAKEGEISWDTPFGKGRPGWHIECSTMALHNLGETIDIHGGGKDLVFPHHENEIAQSESLTGKQFAKYWIHNGLITINGQKMSKSLGNTMTIKDALELYEPEVIKYLMLSKHYSTPLDLNDKEFAVSEMNLYYFYNTFKAIDELKDVVLKDYENNEVFKSINANFIKSMDDDFNTASAISELFQTFKYLNTLIKENKDLNILKAIKNEIIRVYSVIGLLQEDPARFVLSLKNKHLKKANLTVEEIEKLISERTNVKQEKNYVKADEIRNELDAKGIILNDSASGTNWDFKELYTIM